MPKLLEQLLKKPVKGKDHLFIYIARGDTGHERRDTSFFGGGKSISFSVAMEKTKEGRERENFIRKEP